MAHSHSHGDHAHGGHSHGDSHAHAAAEEVSLTAGGEGVGWERHSRAKERATSAQANMAETKANQRYAHSLHVQTDAENMAPSI